MGGLGAGEPPPNWTPFEFPRPQHVCRPCSCHHSVHGYPHVILLPPPLCAAAAPISGCPGRGNGLVGIKAVGAHGEPDFLRSPPGAGAMPPGSGAAVAIFFSAVGQARARLGSKPPDLAPMPCAHSKMRTPGGPERHPGHIQLHWDAMAGERGPRRALWVSEATTDASALAPAFLSARGPGLAGA